eukprot:2967914-Prymnesium_polylepis.1
MMDGDPPFQGNSELEVYSKVTRLDYVTPDFFSDDATELITKLLCPQPERRIGNMRRGSADIQAERWFSAPFDFNDLYDGRMIAPWVPPRGSQG